MTIMSHLKDLKDDFHSDTVLSILNEQRIRGVLCDVTIIVEDTKFKAHSNVLAASSLYFKNIFWSRAICISGHVLELDDLKADVFTEILNYIYSSTVIVKRQETVLDLAAAGKKLGISFLEDLTDKSISNSPCLYSFCSTEKGEVKEEKRQEDSAITNGPRITNAYSIHENENCNNLFSPLDLRASFKKMPEKNKVSNISQERHNAGKGVERVSTLAEHSYAVSMGCEVFQQNSFYRESSPLDRMGEDGSETGQSMPVTDSVPQTFNTSKAVLNSQITDIPSIQLLTVNGTNAVGHQQVVNNHTITFQKSHPNSDTVLPSKDDENNSDHISGSIVALIPHVYNCTKSFSDGTQFSAHLQLHTQAQETLVCKYCSKQFETVTELETHEEGCGGLDNCENDQNCLDNFVISNGQTVTSYINPESTITENELADYSVTNCTMPETDHFVKVVDGQVLYTCSVCKRAYVTLSSLRRHSNVHSWRRTYPCHYCNKVFALAEYRTRHEIWHTGERRYQCIFCLETFMTYYILKNHQKSFHAIDHRLGVNKKTANGGLKPGAYPYKLYRLLPMKCKRPPYKSYSSTSYESIQTSMQVTEDTSSTCIIQNAVTSEVPSLNFPHSILPNATVPLDTSSCSDTTAVPVNTPIIISPWEASVSEAELKADTCTIEIPLSSTHLNSGPQDYDPSLQIVSNSNASENSASVINYNNSPPTVIMHSGRISSVIMHSNAVNTVSSTETADVTTSQAANDDNIHGSEDSKSNIRTRSNKEKKGASLYNEEETSDNLQCMANATMSSDISTDPFESSDKTETYIAKPALPGTSADSSVAPLCQITVKIGNEAIVKRHILGSKLFYRKDWRSKSESKEDHTAQNAEREKRERSTSRVCRSDYIELNEMCDDVSDHDSNDKPWRPYYNYKPKKKSKQLRKIRKARWREKHRSRNSYRESEKTHVTSYALRNIPEEKILQQEEEKNVPSLSCELCEKDSTSDEKAPDNLHWDTTTFESHTCELCQKRFQTPSALRMHMRCHTGEKPYTCKTCGKSFSVSGNLHKHERTHSGVKDFICQYCNKAFSLNETLKIHERIHTGEKRYQCQFCFQGFLYLSTKRNHEQRHKRENNGKGYACVQCPKVCKTAAALGMHQKKHLFKNPKQEDGDDYLFHESTKPFVSQPFIDSDRLETAKPLLNVGADGHETSST